jgi:deazaflavin-dependent oxidoreductase (nitroreductase family)
MPNAFDLKLIDEFRANGGRVGGAYANRELLLLTTVGARSGQPHTTPVAYTRDGDRIVIIASFGGGPRNPGWYYNLLAHPAVTVELGTERFAARAVVTAGEERRRLFEQQARQLPNFTEYQQKTSRQIPVIVLKRVG